MSIQPEGRAVLYRPGIGDGGAEVSDMYHIGPTYGMAAAVIWAIYAWYHFAPDMPFTGTAVTGVARAPT